jgi:hypothetical protein
LLASADRVSHSHQESKVIGRIKSITPEVVTPSKIEGEVKVFTRAVSNVRGISKKIWSKDKLTRATPPATKRPRAETPFIEAAPVA